MKCYSFILKAAAISLSVILFYSPSKSFCEDTDLKSGWSKESIESAINGCTSGMINPNLQSYRNAAARDGHIVTEEEMKEVYEMMLPIFRPTCRCIVLKTAREFTFSEVQVNPQQLNQYGEYLINTGQCPMPQPPGS